MKIMQENIVEMGNYKAIVFTNCWGCNQFLTMTPHLSKYIITLSRYRKKMHGNDVKNLKNHEVLKCELKTREKT